ncbi:MAG: PD40 domain-containing protein [Opitutaceae bacterium]|nr:PD40 domain-containing protein [Opitutaceae bacterium]
MTRFRFFSTAGAVIALLCVTIVGACAQDYENIGVITKPGDAAVTPVRIVSDQPEFEQIATMAFRTHGAFSVSASAPTVIRFSAAGGTSVRVAIQRGGQTGFTQDVAGTSLRNALFRAADAAVSQITRKPGFFAGKLAFISEQTGRSEVYTSDLFFGETLRMTSDRAQCITPRWAPDGRRILYTSYFANGAPDIYLIDTGARSRTAFVSVKGTNTGGRFSPDGSRVAAVLGKGDLYVGTAGGRGFAPLTRTPTQIEATPSWSPDGARIVYTSDAQATGKPQLYIVGAGGGTPTRVPTNVSGYCAEPDWSHADRNLIAFTAASGRGYQIAVFSFATGSAKVVSNVAGDGIEPCWTSDGRHLVFTKRTASSQRICVLDTQSGRVTEISPANYGKCYQASFILR